MSPRGFNAGWLVGAVLLSSWAISSASDQGSPGRAPRPDAALPLPAVSADVDRQIARLAAWNQAATTPTARRNPFKFEVRGSKFEVPRVEVPRVEVPRVEGTGVEGTRLEVPADERRTAPEAQSTSNLAPRTSNLPAPRLTGVVSHAGVVTAVVSVGDALHFVKRGDVIAGRYRVDSVSSDAVDVFDLTLGTILRLTLQSLT